MQNLNSPNAKVEEWALDGFIVSFKLETDKDLIEKKSLKALERYGHHVVVANMLKVSY